MNNSMKWFANWHIAANWISSATIMVSLFRGFVRRFESRVEYCNYNGPEGVLLIIMAPFIRNAEVFAMFCEVADFCHVW